MKTLALGCLVSVIILALNGCGSSRAYEREELERLKARTAQLESEIGIREREYREIQDELGKERQRRQTLDEELHTLRSELEATAKREAQVRAERKRTLWIRPGVEQIQIALRNAGLNPGPIDGKLGKKTRRAIKAFQRANGLASDGVVGKETWAKLSEYLE